MVLKPLLIITNIYSIMLKYMIKMTYKYITTIFCHHNVMEVMTMLFFLFLFFYFKWFWRKKSGVELYMFVCVCVFINIFIIKCSFLNLYYIQKNYISISDMCCVFFFFKDWHWRGEVYYLHVFSHSKLNFQMYFSVTPFGTSFHPVFFLQTVFKYQLPHN